MFINVKLNFFNQSIPSSGVMSVLSVISICNFCCYCIHYLKYFYLILSSAGILEIGDSVSIMNFFSKPFSFTVDVRHLFLSVNIFNSSIR